MAAERVAEEGVDSKPIDVSRYYCKFRLHKYGPLPDEFSEALNTKIKSLLKKSAGKHQQEISGMQYAIKSVLSNLSTSFNVEKPNKPERMRRNSSRNGHTLREDCTGAKTVPSFVEVMVAVQNAASPESVYQKYLANKVSKALLMQLINSTTSYNMNYMLTSLLKFLKINATLHSDISDESEAWCSKLDYCSSQLLALCDHMSDFDVNELIMLGRCFESCEGIVFLHTSNDWANKNDLMKESEWRTWKAQMCLVASLMAMMVVLLLVLKLCQFRSACYDLITNYDDLKFLWRIYAAYPSTIFTLV